LIFDALRFVSTPGMEGFTLGMEPFAPGMGSATPGMKTFESGMETFTPGMGSATLRMESVTPGTASVTPGMDALTPRDGGVPTGISVCAAHQRFVTVGSYRLISNNLESK